MVGILVKLSMRNNLPLNVSETKKMVVDFWWGKKREKKTVNDPINIIGEEVKQLILGCSFEYGCHVEEGMRRFYFLSRLRSFSVWSRRCWRSSRCHGPGSCNPVFCV